MADNHKDRAPNDLPVPETMQIAALLAELMPPGALASSASESATSVKLDERPVNSLVSFDDMPDEPAEIADDSPRGIAGAPGSLTVVDSTLMPLVSSPPVAAQPSSLTVVDSTLMPVPPPAPAPSPRQPAAPPATAVPSGSKAVASTPPRFEARLQPGRPKQPPLEPPTRRVEAEPPPIKPSVESEKRGPAKATKPSRPADDLIPLGDLSVSGYFSLVNWRNDPEQARHPRRSDYGLDEQTLALARKNPFYVIGQPRRPESRNVAEVLSEIAWE
jgi:hypothetical protein